MDKEKRTKKQPFFETVAAEIKRSVAERRKDKGALFADISVFLAAFFFARTHILFGSYPLATAFVAVLPSRVWIGLIGAVAGALSLGRVGIIHAIIALVILLMRLVVSGSRREGGILFCEPLIMRLAAATVGAFVGAGYEMLLSGFSFPSVLFGVFGVGLTLGFAFMFSGLFFADISVREFLFGRGNIFRKREGKEAWGLTFFQGSLAISAFLLAYSLNSYTYFGISFSYIFVFLITLFVAKRFGVIRAMAIGFISSVGISASLSPAFALAGIGAGVLFNFGLGYGIVGAGLVAVGWSGYVEGMSGFLSLFPEYMIAAIISAPLIRKLHSEKREEEMEKCTDKASDMVGAYWLAERKRISSLSSLEDSLYGASDKIRNFSISDGVSDFEEFRRIVIMTFSDMNITPCEENINKLATKVYKKQKLSPSDAEPVAVGEVAERLIEELVRRIAIYEKELYESRRACALGEEYELISRMINESLLYESRESAQNEAMTALATEVFCRFGFPDGDIKVFGESQKRVVGAGLDPDGRLITSPDLKRTLEEALGVRLGDYQYFRKGDMALFSASAVSSLSVNVALAGVGASDIEVSGDTAHTFTYNSTFFAILSDGMGKGKDAKESSEFVTEYLSEMLTSNATVATSMAALNHLIRNKAQECCASLDLFSLDLIGGEGTFVKSGAAPSYVKRDKSIYRIESKTAPIGLLKSVDAEKIRVEIKSEDYIIMLSDGVSASAEDSPWLLSYLTKTPPADLAGYAEEILSLAKENSKSRDDMTVVVLKISAKG